MNLTKLMFSSYFNVIIEKLVNQYIKCDPDYQFYLKPLIGKTICIKTSQPSIILNLQFNFDEIKLLDSHYSSPDCTLSAQSFKLIQLALNQSASYQQLEISGDTEVAQSFATLCHNVRIDWETLLAKVFGDTIAYTLGNKARQVKSRSKEFSSTLMTNFQEFVQHEIRAFPASQEIGNFMDKVDTLRHDTDRLIARMKKLKDQLQG